MYIAFYLVNFFFSLKLYRIYIYKTAKVAKSEAVKKKNCFIIVNLLLNTCGNLHH